MVIWASKLIGTKKQSLPVMQCNIAEGQKRHKKTMRWLINRSYKLPLLVIQETHAELFSKAKSLAKWREGDFIKFACNYDGEITGVTVIPADESVTA